MLKVYRILQILLGFGAGVGFIYEYIFFMTNPTIGRHTWLVALTAAVALSEFLCVCAVSTFVVHQTSRSAPLGYLFLEAFVVAFSLMAGVLHTSNSFGGPWPVSYSLIWVAAGIVMILFGFIWLPRRHALWID